MRGTFCEGLVEKGLYSDRGKVDSVSVVHSSRIGGWYIRGRFWEPHK